MKIKNIKSHTENKLYLENAWKSNRFPHLLLFDGPKSVGKFSLSLNLAYQLLVNNDINFSSNFPEETFQGKGEKFFHPDLLVLGNDEGRKEITIDEIRGIKKFFSLSPAASKFRIAIIDNAENLNMNAQNGLLKILEEPPENSFIILIAHSVERLLITVKSRVIKLKFHPFSPEEIKLIIKREDFTTNSLIEQGFSITNIEKWHSLSYNEIYKVILNFLFSLKTPFEIYESVESWCKKEKVATEEFFEIINVLNTRMMKYKLNNQVRPLVENEMETFSKIMPKIHYQSLLELQLYISNLTTDCQKFSLDFKTIAILILSKYCNTFK
jgi:hypothetical protein